MSKSVSMDYELAQELGLSAALLFNNLQFWDGKGKRDDGWIYKSYEEIMRYIPLSDSTIYRAYKTLKAAGLIETKVMRVDNKPTLHYRIAKPVSVKMTETIETVKMTETINTVINNINMSESELLTTLNDATGRKFRVLPRGWKKTAQAFTLEEIKTALLALKEDSWHAARIDSLSSSYLLKAETIDRFIAGASTERTIGWD